jgi:hypothetical protein
MSRNKILKEEAPEIPDLILRLQSQAKDKHISKDKILKDIRNVRHQLYSESFGDE